MRYLLLFITLIFLSGCSTGESTQQKTLRIGMNTWPGYEPVVLAKELDYLNKNTSISRVDSATNVIKALRSNIIDVACITLDEAILLQNRTDERIKIINVLDFSAGGDVILAKPYIKSMEDLKGKKIGVEASALGLFMLSRALHLTKDLDIDDIQILNISYDRHELEFKNSNIDAIVTFEPVKTRLLKYGAHVIFDSTQIPHEIVDVMIAKESTILEKKESIQNLIDAWYSSTDYIQKHKDEAMLTMAGYEEISKEEFKIAYNGLQIPSRQQSKIFLEKKLDATLHTITTTLFNKEFPSTQIQAREFYTLEFMQGK